MCLLRSNVYKLEHINTFQCKFWWICNNLRLDICDYFVIYLQCIKLSCLQTLNRHWLAYADVECDSKLVMNPGNLHWRSGGEKHINDPLSVANLQVTCSIMQLNLKLDSVFFHIRDFRKAVNFYWSAKNTLFTTYCKVFQ